MVVVTAAARATQEEWGARRRIWMCFMNQIVALLEMRVKRMLQKLTPHSESSTVASHSLELICGKGSGGLKSLGLRWYGYSFRIAVDDWLSASILLLPALPAPKGCIANYQDISAIATWVQHINSRGRRTLLRVGGRRWRTSTTENQILIKRVKIWNYTIRGV